MAALQIARFESKENDNNKDAEEIVPVLRSDVAAKNFKIEDTIDIKPIDKGNYVLIPSDWIPRRTHCYFMFMYFRYTWTT